MAEIAFFGDRTGQWLECHLHGNVHLKISLSNQAEWTAELYKSQAYTKAVKKMQATSQRISECMFKLDYNESSTLKFSYSFPFGN